MQSFRESRFRRCSWSHFMRKGERRLSMNRTNERERHPIRWERENRRQSSLQPKHSLQFMIPPHAEERKAVLHDHMAWLKKLHRHWIANCKANLGRNILAMIRCVVIL